MTYQRAINRIEQAMVEISDHHGPFAQDLLLRCQRLIEEMKCGDAVVPRAHAAADGIRAMNEIAEHEDNLETVERLVGVERERVMTNGVTQVLSGMTPYSVRDRLNVNQKIVTKIDAELQRREVVPKAMADDTYPCPRCNGTGRI